MFFRKHKRKRIEGSKFDPSVLEGFINKVNDIILVANYDETIEVINKPEIIENYKSLEDFFDKKNNEELYTDMMNTIKSDGSFIGNIEITKNNENIRLYVAAYLVQSTNKLFFYIKDDSKYFLKEKELLEEIDKQEELLKSKDLFIANLSHEIKTPMNIIVGMIYFLKNTQLDEKQLEYVNKLDDASKMLLGITSDVLNLSKDEQYISTSSLVNFEMKKFIQNTVEVFEQRANDKGIQIYTDIDLPEDVNVYADKTKLNQIFVNLIDNAIKYTDKGYISLSVKKIEENNINYKLQFCLKDTGIGIKREDTLKIFREFSQAEDPTTKTIEGRGMGLAIIKKIIENMDGKIWVESSVGLGSKFYFTVTLDKANQPIENKEKIEEEIIEKKLVEEENKVKHQGSENHKIKRILLVEDNEMNIDFTTTLIKELDYLCDVAEDGVKCIKEIQQKGANYYDLVLMDIHLPRYNGYEISKILKQDIRITAPIVALTATNVTQKVVEENASNIASYILKPIIPTEFKERLKELLENDDYIEESIIQKRNILLFGTQDNQLKENLSKNFNVTTSSREEEIEILLQTGLLEVIVIDEIEDIEKEIRVINKIRNDISSNIPIILISRNQQSDLKERAYGLKINGIIENNELNQCHTALYNLLSKIEEKDKLKVEVEKSKEEIDNVYNFLFDSMVNLTSIKSKETGQHLRRTKEYMKVMLTQYEEFYKEGLFTSKETIEDIAMAAVLHDIGKVGISDSILNKPGKLTDEEYEIMKTHVIIGKEILETTYGNKISNIILQYAKDIIYHHHEKYDGTGYPEKLKGEEISVIVRNMTLIDVYDALANKRVYKPAMPYEEIEEYIKEQSGKAFDPKIVNIFFLVKDKLKDINESIKDKE